MENTVKLQSVYKLTKKKQLGNKCVCFSHRFLSCSQLFHSIGRTPKQSTHRPQSKTSFSFTELWKMSTNMQKKTTTTNRKSQYHILPSLRHAGKQDATSWFVFSPSPAGKNLPHSRSVQCESWLPFGDVCGRGSSLLCGTLSARSSSPLGLDERLHAPQTKLGIKCPAPLFTSVWTFPPPPLPPPTQDTVA